jgi:hypothetical protein
MHIIDLSMSIIDFLLSQRGEWPGKVDARTLNFLCATCFNPQKLGCISLQC